jgi:hypothetical protein
VWWDPSDKDQGSYRPEAVLYLESSPPAPSPPLSIYSRKPVFFFHNPYL